VIGSLLAFLSRNHHVAVQLQDNSVRHLHVNYLSFNGFLCNISYSFYNFWKTLLTCSTQKKLWKDFLISAFIIDTIN